MHQKLFKDVFFKKSIMSLNKNQRGTTRQRWPRCLDTVAAPPALSRTQT